MMISDKTVTTKRSGILLCSDFGKFGQHLRAAASSNESFQAVRPASSPLTKYGIIEYRDSFFHFKIQIISNILKNIENDIACNHTATIHFLYTLTLFASGLSSLNICCKQS